MTSAPAGVIARLIRSFVHRAAFTQERIVLTWRSSSLTQPKVHYSSSYLSRSLARVGSRERRERRKRNGNDRAVGKEEKNQRARTREEKVKVASSATIKVEEGSGVEKVEKGP